MAIAGLTAVLGTLLSVGGDIYSMILGQDATKKAQREAREMYDADIDRRDKIDRYNMRMGRAEFKYKKKESKLDRAEREKDRQYTKRERNWDKEMDILNQNTQLSNNLLGVLQRPTTGLVGRSAA